MPLVFSGLTLRSVARLKTRGGCHPRRLASGYHAVLEFRYKENGEEERYCQKAPIS